MTIVTVCIVLTALHNVVGNSYMCDQHCDCVVVFCVDLLCELNDVMFIGYIVRKNDVMFCAIFSSYICKNVLYNVELFCAAELS